MSGPPFDRYPVSSADIRARADSIGKSGKPLAAVGDAMDGPRRQAADAVDGELDGQIEGPVDPAQRDAMSTAAGATFCGGAIDLYANHVDLFNLAIDDLNARWNTAVEHDFDVSRSGKSEAEHDAAVADARGVLAQQLRKEYATAEKELDDGAEDVATVLNKGPAEGAPLLAAYTVNTQLAIFFGRLFGGGPLTLDEIQRKYQVGDDPNGMVLIPGIGFVTASEAWMLGNLGLLALSDMKDIRDKAFSTADGRFTPEDHNDNHNDAFRHAYWNALMARRFGPDWTENYTNAHERVPGNQPVREAMDLYNNEVGRRIATENPDASDEEIADLVEQAVRDGEMLVIGPDGKLAWSNTIEEGGQTADSKHLPEKPVDGNPENDPNSNADPDSHNEHGSGS